MRIDIVEIFSDTTNRVVMRHPERNFPGVLIQGVELFSLCSSVEAVHASLGAEGFKLLSQDTKMQLFQLRETLLEHLDHYGKVLAKHGNREPLRWSRTFRK